MGFGFASDKIVKHMSARGEMKAEYRLPPMIPGCTYSHPSPTLHSSRIFTVIFSLRSTSLILIHSFPHPHRPLHLRLDCREARPLDRSHNRNSIRRPRSPGNVHASNDLSSGRLHHLRCLRHRREHYPSKLTGSAAASGGKEDVSDVGTRMGEQSAGFHCACHVSNCVDFLSLWGEDTDKSTVSSQLLSRGCQLCSVPMDVKLLSSPTELCITISAWDVRLVFL